VVWCSGCTTYRSCLPARHPGPLSPALPNLCPPEAQRVKAQNVRVCRVASSDEARKPPLLDAEESADTRAPRSSNSPNVRLPSSQLLACTRTVNHPNRQSHTALAGAKVSHALSPSSPHPGHGTYPW